MHFLSKESPKVKQAAAAAAATTYGSTTGYAPTAWTASLCI